MHHINPDRIIQLLAANADVFRAALSEIPTAMITWKPSPQDWCLLEVACHLYDEERDDFRARVMSTLGDPHQPWPRIDPQGWVTNRNYMEQDFGERTAAFLEERAASIAGLRSLADPQWEAAYQHPVVGSVTAKALLENWLAHDYLHLRQINRRKYGFLAAQSSSDLRYAGDW